MYVCVCVCGGGGKKSKTASKPSVSVSDAKHFGKMKCWEMGAQWAQEISVSDGVKKKKSHLIQS